MDNIDVTRVMAIHRIANIVIIISPHKQDCKIQENFLSPAGNVKKIKTCHHEHTQRGDALLPITRLSGAI